MEARTKENFQDELSNSLYLYAGHCVTNMRPKTGFLTTRLIYCRVYRVVVEARTKENFQDELSNSLYLYAGHCMTNMRLVLS